jgi:hypothetical protein
MNRERQVNQFRTNQPAEIRHNRDNRQNRKPYLVGRS